MFELINKGGLYCIEASVPFKNQDKWDVVELVLDTGGVLTIIDSGITDYLGYSAQDAFKKSSLDGAVGRSEGYLIKVPGFRCLGFEIKDFIVACHDMNSKLGVAGILGMNFLNHFRTDIDWYTGQIHSIKRLD
jgi:predicted aspartyl protease